MRVQNCGVMGAPLVSCLLFTFSLAAAQGLEYALKGHELYIKPPDFLPPQKILWRRNGKEVVRVNGREQQVYDSYKGRIMLNRYSAELWIEDVRFEDGGEYKLEVWHRNQEHPTQSYYHFEVIAKVSITSVSCEMDGDLQAKLACSAESSHPQLLTFEWSFNGNQYPGSNLMIGLNEHDKRVFTCRVKDPLSRDKATLAASKCFPEKHQIVILIAVVIVPIVIIVLVIVGLLYWRRRKEKAPVSLAAKDSNEVVLQDCGLSEGSGSFLSAVLSSPSSRLTLLDLSNNYMLKDRGVELLSAGLKSRRCCLETLRLSRCGLTMRSGSLLSSVLSTKSSRLTQLDLSQNMLMREGVELLSAGLMSPRCRLETLRLIGCGLFTGSGSLLSSVLSTPSSRLTQLDLSENILEDLGVELLSAGLKSPHCRLQSLRLKACLLSERSGAHLSSVLSCPSSRLTQLDLSENNLQNPGVDKLSAGLMSSHCHLKTLSLSKCNLYERSGSLLSSVLSSPSSHLTHLDLSLNHKLEDVGVEKLSVGLKSPHCHLESLRLKACLLSERSGAHLSSVLSCPSSRLTQLDLSENDLQNPGVEQLSAGLKSPHCHLESLSLSECRISERGFASLASALTSNPSHLRELDLSYNLPGGPGLEQLSAGLENPDWKLETLRYGQSSRTHCLCSKELQTEHVTQRQTERM